MPSSIVFNGRNHEEVLAFIGAGTGGAVDRGCLTLDVAGFPQKILLPNTEITRRDDGSWYCMASPTTCYKLSPM